MHSFETVCAAMADPGFYPHPVSGLRRVETHISVVFLTGQWVYKLKKPVDLGFLDFRDLSARRKYCQREVTLNRRLSRGVYQRVVRIVEDPQKGFCLGGKGATVEVAVQMKQLPEEAGFDYLLRHAKVRPADLRKLGRKLALFYSRGESDPVVNAFGRRDAIIFNTEENFSQIAPYAQRLLDEERWRFVCEVNRSFLSHARIVFERRIENGKIRDGHGDLRTDHIYFHNGIQVIDCIEFNDRFRYGDVAADLAFLHMDMARLGVADLSQVVLQAYVDAAQDPGIYAVLDFYAAYRAIVRLKVACMRHDQAPSPALRDEIAGHLDQAYFYTLRFSRPTLWVFSGLPASGKSALAERLGYTLHIPVFSSDAVRKQTDPATGIEPYGKGQYSAERRRHIYTRLLTLAQEKLKKGRPVILDATYSTRALRAEVVQLAADLDATLLLVECTCSRRTLTERLRARETSAGLSDARIDHLPEMIAHFEPVAELPADTHIQVKTDAPLDRTVHRILAQAYLRTSAQIERRVGNGTRAPSTGDTP
jgi:aminoglycoside phosphotransferase family enzyme